MKKFTLLFIGVCAMFILKAQNVGIGTVSPGSPLTVAHVSISGYGLEHTSLNGTVRIRSYLYSSAGQIGTFTSHPFDIMAGNGTAQLRLMPTGVVGIGAGDAPSIAGLVADKRIGAANAIFGSNLTGVAIESDYPGVGFNTYYNGTRRIINNGYGSLVGQDPLTGRFYIATSAATTTGQGTAVTLTDRISIDNEGRVGIGISIPNAKLHVAGSLQFTGIGEGTGKVLTSNSSGNATWQVPAGTGVGFRAYLSSDISRSGSNNTVVNFIEDHDDGNNFNAVTGIFTAPSAGMYHFTANAGWGGAPGGTLIDFTTRIIVEFATGGSDFIVQSGFPVTNIANYGKNFVCSGDYKLSAGDKVHVEVSHSYSSNLTLYGNSSSQTTFSGFKVY